MLQANLQDPGQLYGLYTTQLGDNTTLLIFAFCWSFLNYMEWGNGTTIDFA